MSLAAGLSLAERQTLLIDLDPQGNATTGLGISKSDLPRTIYQVLLEGAPIREATLPTELSFLTAVPSNIAGMVVFIDPGHNGANDASIGRQVPALRAHHDFLAFESFRR